MVFLIEFELLTLIRFFSVSVIDVCELVIYNAAEFLSADCVTHEQYVLITLF